jgi:DNA polymerase-3 subunit delta
MKLTGKDATSFCLYPKPAPAILLHGEPESKILGKYQSISERLVGENAKTEMRVTELSGAEIRKDKGLVIDATKAIGFFPGPRMVFIKNGTDGLSDLFSDIIHNYQEGDAFIIVTANKLNTRSKLRKLFESSKTAISIGVYPDPLTTQEIELAIKNVGIQNITKDARKNLEQLAKSVEYNEFEQVLEKIFLYKIDDDTPISSEDISKCINLSSEIELDDLINKICEGNTKGLSPLLLKLNTKGQTPTSTYIIINQYFRNLHMLAIQPSNIEQAISRIRPPVFGDRRNKLLSNSRKWGVKRLEKALNLLHENGLTLRSSKPIPQQAVIDRTLIKISMMISK